MADIYVRSTDGNNADNGSTWALAKATLAGAAAIDAAGDTIWLSQVHAESNAATQSITLAGTRAAPTRIICANDSAAPPTTTAANATITTTGSSNINFTAVGAAYVYGITFICGTGASLAIIAFNGTIGARMIFENCSFQLATTTGNKFAITGQQGSYTQWKNCTVKFNNNGHALNLAQPGHFHWIGGSFLSGTSSPSPAGTGLVSSSVAGGRTIIEDVDLSNLGSTLILADSTSVGNVIFRNCKLPGSWSGTLVRTTDSSAAGRVSMYNCAASTQNYRMWVETGEGSIRDETTIVRSGGASDGATPISWKMVSLTTCSIGVPLYSDEIVFWCGNTGTAITLDIHLVHDSVTNLTNAEVWVEASYLGSSAQPIATLISDCRADPVVAGVDQDASSVTWTTTGLTNPNKQKLSVTFTPQMKGFVIARICLAKASKTVYVCPKVEASGLVNRAQYQVLGSFNNRFCSGAYINIMNNTKQEHIPGNNFIMESASSSPLIQDDANYFMAC